MRKINKLIIHCADTPPSMDIGVEEIRKWHVEERGWDDIGYHYVIRRNGVVEEGREIEEVGAHCKGHNGNSIGICLVGGREGRFDFTRKQLHSLNRLVADLKDSISGGASVHGHYEFSEKTCPNFNVKEWFIK